MNTKELKYEEAPLYGGDVSDCCKAELELRTDGDADWFGCTECEEDCGALLIS